MKKNCLTNEQFTPLFNDFVTLSETKETPVAIDAMENLFFSR